MDNRRPLVRLDANRGQVTKYNVRACDLDVNSGKISIARETLSVKKHDFPNFALKCDYPVV